MEGACKLCLGYNKLRNSHVIPEFAYTDVYVHPDPSNPDNRKLATLSFEKGATLQLTREQKGLREYLLCQKCETQFSRYELYAAKEIRSIHEHLQNNIFQQTVDYKKFRLFQLSILWRCGITEKHPQLRIELGNKHLENLRTILVREELGAFHQYPCIMNAVHSEGHPQTDGILVDEGGRINGLRIHRIFFCGILWTYFVGALNHRIGNTEIEKQAFLQESGLLMVLPIEMKRVEFLMKYAEKVRG